MRPKVVIADHGRPDFGTKMRRLREDRGVPLRQIADATKISIGVLEALERNDVSRMPSGIFSRAFVRSYATEVGLNPEETVRDFMVQFPHDSVTAGSPHAAKPMYDLDEPRRRRRGRPTTVVALVALSVLIGVILFFTLAGFLMDTLFRTPFLDIFKQGGVDRDIRMMVAEGALGLRAEELRLTLEYLLTDPDPEIAHTAEATLLAVRAGDAAAAQPYVPPEPDPEPEEHLTPEEKETKRQSTLQKIASLNPAQRLALAMKGSREERAVLIRDPNKIVAVAVLSSPKISESEVAAIAKMANISEEILRIIGNTRAWMKSYTVTSSLVKNPKCPVAVSMNLLQRLNEKDLKLLTSDRNVPDVLRSAARKKLTPVK